MIQIFDSYSKKYKEVNSKSINMYVCGITTSDYCHLGHAFSSVSFEILDRFLSSQGFDVTRIQNFTDVDDKIIAKSLEEEISAEDVSKKYIKAFFEDMDALGVKRANLYPKATDEISNIIEFIKKLEKKNLTYSINGSIYFRVSKFEKYGMLSSRDISNSLSGTRVNDNLNKESDGDFALWKSSKPDEPFWESPWGKGRPGWHIECSAMSEKCLGIPFDIHCGGIDLTFPHHENEIAQSCSAFKKNSDPQSFCKYWFHNGFVTVDGEKMSKSLGNITLINDLLSKYSGPVIRLSLLSSHYRQPLDWSTKILEQSKKTLKKFENFFDKIPSEYFLKDSNSNFDNEFLNSLYDDLNTPRALASLNKLFDKVKDPKKDDKKMILSFAKCFQLLGINLNKNNDESNFVTKSEKKIIFDLIQEREAARKLKDFERADNIRDKLKKMNINIEDSVEGTKWIKNE